MSKIKALKEREQCRNKVSIWFGSKDNYTHPLKEILANSIDEIYNNYEEGNITVWVSDDLKTIKVTDTGGGIPLYGKTNGIENYKLLLLQLFAGTNYDNAINGRITTGTNGVGLTVTNYCSKYFKVESVREGKKCSIVFENGATNDYKLKVVEEDKSKHGTCIIFTLDDEVFTNTKYDIKEIHDICRNLAGAISSLKAKINIDVIYSGLGVVFRYDSLKDYLEYITRGSRENIMVCESSKNLNLSVNQIDCVLSFSTNPIRKSFLNMTYLSEGGTIVKGIVCGIKDYLNKYFTIEEKKIKKKSDEISINDIESSVSFICNVLSSNAEYSNQTKLSTNKNDYYKASRKYIMDSLAILKIENSSLFKNFAYQVLEVKKHNDKILESHKIFKKKILEKSDNFLNIIDGLVDCKIHGEESELFIAEGKSALSSIVTARNPINQGAIAIRGKILNCLKSDMSEILKNETIINLVRTIGCGIEVKGNHYKFDSFDITKLKYGKIILTCDADADAKQIICLLLTMFYVLMPQLLKQNKIYIALTPLFEIYDCDKKEYIYAHTESEKEEIIKNIRKYTIHRNKGLGEMDADVMAKTGIDPATRTILQVNYENVEKIINTFNEWLGLDGSKRKEYIVNDLNKYSMED